MNTVEQVGKDKINAMREKDAYIKSITQILSARFLNSKIELKRELTEDEALAIVRKEQKQTQDSLADAKKAGRNTAEYEAQITYLSALLPAAMSAKEVAARVAKIAQGVADGNKGAIMKAVMAELKGKADGKEISAAVDAYLANA